MEPERLIIEAIRDKLRDAYGEWAAVERRAEFAHSHWSTMRDYQGFTKDGETIEYDPEHHVAVARGYEVEINTCRLAVQNWEQALTVALDKLTR